MRWVPLALALLALPLSGCAEVSDRLGASGGAGGAAAALPYYREYREDAVPREERSYVVPVEAGARLLNVTASLLARDAGLGLPSAAPAALDVEVRDPSGETRAFARLDAVRPSRSLLVEPPVAPGEFVVLVRGVGASQDVDGAPVGAGYELKVEVLYG